MHWPFYCRSQLTYNEADDPASELSDSGDSSNTLVHTTRSAWEGGQGDSKCPQLLAGIQHISCLGS
jgi:hypothetical protein